MLDKIRTCKEDFASRKAQHTPGPWLVTNSHIANGEWVTCICPEKEDGTIALVIGSKARSGYVDESPVSEANARLIAAAPDLLRELERTNERIKELCESLPKEEMTVFNGLQNIIRLNNAAIAKARGESYEIKEAI